MAAKKKGLSKIEQTVFVPATPKDVYTALVNAREHSAFTGAAATGIARKGARFTAWDGYISGRHVELSPGKKIVQEWQTTEWPEGLPPSRLELRFKKKRDGTEVTLIQTNVPTSQVAAYREGWREFYWAPLKGYFSGEGC